MDLEKSNFVESCHCPDCNGLYIIIDNDIIFCPLCESEFNQNKSETYEEETKKELVQYQV